MLLLHNIFILCVVAAAVSAEENGWCAPKLCPPGTEPHVGCKDEIKWASSCEEAEQIEMTPELQQIILDEHNRLRNQQAMGKTQRFPPAKRMATMTWDDELAGLAGYNTLQCQMKHDTCRSTWNFYQAGQNLALRSDDTNEAIAKWAPGFWFSEYKLAKASDIKNFNRLQNSDGKDIGHFTQIVMDQAYKVGCSMSKYTKNGQRKALIACNYAVTNIQDYPIYADGPTASECTSGTNPKYPGLCSENEKYDPFIRYN